MIYDSILSIGLILILVGMCMADGEDLRMSITFMAIGCLLYTSPSPRDTR